MLCPKGRVGSSPTAGTAQKGRPSPGGPSAQIRSHRSSISNRPRRVSQRCSPLSVAAERGHEEDLRLGGHPVRTDLFAPTLIDAIYGMNFDNMPELHWAFGYPLAVGAMLAFALLLYVIFKRQKWM